MDLWDILLLLSVPTMGCCVAYLREPRHKALVISLPIPFSIATLAVGRPVNAPHVAGLLLLLGFWYAVYGFRVRTRVPILLAIALSALGYCALGAPLARFLPQTEMTFWATEGVVLLAGMILYARIGPRNEGTYRSPLPIWIKAPILAAVVLGLIGIKTLLGGVMTVFPMVGVLTAYEGRHSLWTLCRQVPILMLSMGPMMAVIHLIEPHLGIAPALGCGWLTLGLLQVALMRYRGDRDRHREHGRESSPPGERG